MDEHNLMLQEFFVEGTARHKSHVLLHITEPTTPAEKKKGYFFAIAEIENGSIEHIEDIQTMIDDLESGVYETDSTPEKSAFEITLEYINRRGHHLLAHQGITHIIVGVLHKDSIQFAYHGSAAARLIYQSEEQTYEQVDVLADESLNDTQLFSAVLEGSIAPGDYFFVATPAVVPLIANKLSTLLPAAPPKQTAATIDALARSSDRERSFGGIIMTVVAEEVVEEKDTDERPPNDSIVRLASITDRTRQTVHTPLIPTSHRSNQKRRRHTGGPTNADLPLGNQLLVLLGKGIVGLLRIILAILLRIVIVIKNIFVNLFILSTNIGGQRQYVLDSIKRWGHDRRRAYTELPMISKVLFFATIVAALIFVGSILFLRAREAKEAELATYVHTVQAINDKRDAAESSLIYRDNERAFTLLDEARSMIATLPEKSEEEQAQKRELTESIEHILVTLRNMRVVTPEVFVTLTDTNPAAQATSLVRVGDTIIAYGTTDPIYYPINMNTRGVETRDHSTIPSLLAADAPKEFDYVSFLTGPTSLATLNPESFTLSAATIGSPVETTLADIAIYNRRAYTLSPSSDQIYRHSPTQTGFDGGTAWITTSADLSDAIAMAIDGDVYVLTATGEVMKFFGGARQSFTIGGLDPVLTAPTDIWTYTDVNFVYILEPTENRIVVLHKDGSLSVQYTAEAWNEPEAFVVNPATNEIYVLDDNVVYRFSTRE